MSFYKDKFSLLDGNILLYTTTTQKNQMWQMRLKFPKHLHKGYITKSTGCVEFGAAASFAEEFYWKTYSDLKDGVQVGVDRGFTSQFDNFMQFQRLNMGMTLSIHTIKNFQYFRRYWCEFFGDKDVRYITTQVIDEYMVWRMNYWNGGAGKDKKMPANGVKVPSPGTMRQDRQRLKQFFVHLLNTNIIRFVPTFNTMSQEVATRRKVGRRDHFTKQEWNRVSNRLNAYAFGKGSESLGARNSYERKLLYYYIMISANLGTRPGETRKLKWSYVDFKVHPDDPSVEFVHVKVPPTSKTGRYTATGTHNCVKYFKGVRELFKSRFEREPTSADFVFTAANGDAYKYPENTFRKLLREWNEYEDADGRVRNIYSLRGFYITQLLEKGVDINTVSKMCGTSVKQIQSHYDRSGVKISADILTPGFLKS